MKQEQPPARTPQRTSRALGVFMLALLMAFQPALGLASSAPIRASCGPAPEKLLIEPAGVASSCCCEALSDTGRETEPRIGRASCTCNAVPAPIPPLSSLIPLAVESNNARLAAFYAKATLRVSTGFELWASRPPLQSGAPPPSRWLPVGGSRGTWALDSGGVSLLLALLSTARI